MSYQLPKINNCIWLLTKYMAHYKRWMVVFWEFIILKSWEKCNRNIAMGIELNQNDKKSVNIQN